jgi:hypothetical protein
VVAPMPDADEEFENEFSLRILRCSGFAIAA